MRFVATRRSSRFAVGAFKVAAAAISPFVIYIAWMRWDIHQVASFCADVKPGATLASLAQIADEQGIHRHWVNAGIFDEVQKDWVFYVPVASTFGEIACAVHHDKSVVVSTRMDGV